MKHRWYDAKRLMFVIRAVMSLAMLASVFGIVIAQIDTSAIFTALSAVPAGTVLLALFCMLTGSLLASARVKMVAGDLGYRLTWRNALAALVLGQIGGAVFFQLAGQLVARGAYLSRRGVPVAATVLMVGYERFLALIVSLTMASVGAWYVFGRLVLDMESGDGLIKLVVGILLAVAAGAWLGWGRRALEGAAALVGASLVYRLTRTVVLSIGIQILTAVAYIVLVRTMAPAIPLIDLAAGCVVVMFAASLPISLAGWGVRELSAVFVLSAVGVPPAAALVTAVVIGVGSLLVLLPLGALALTGTNSAPEDSVPPAPRIDYSALTALVVPLAAATAVFFNIRVPTQAGGLNVNLADPLALLGGALFLVSIYAHRALPRWRLPHFNLHILFCTIVVTTALLIGASRIGWTEWALSNKFVGWFVLLGYGATGALVATTTDKRNMRLLLITLMAAGLAIASLELFLNALHGIELNLSLSVSGFAGNRNAFAFQMLMLIAVTIAVGYRHRLTTGTLAVALAALVYAGSRAGYGTAAIMLGTAVWIDALSWRQAVRALVYATCIAVTINFLWFVGQIVSLGSLSDSLPLLATSLPKLLPDESTATERIRSLTGALEIFRSHPLVGGGLGSFIDSELRTTGNPLVIHSTPLWIAAEMGLIGLLVFITPIFRIFRQEIGRCPDDPAACLLVLVITGFSVMSLVHEMLYQRTFWLLLGAGLAWLTATRRPDAGLALETDQRFRTRAETRR